MNEVKEMEEVIAEVKGVLLKQINLETKNRYGKYYILVSFTEEQIDQIADIITSSGYATELETMVLKTKLLGNKQGSTYDLRIYTAYKPSCPEAVDVPVLIDTRFIIKKYYGNLCIFLNRIEEGK